MKLVIPPYKAMTLTRYSTNRNQNSITYKGVKI